MQPVVTALRIINIIGCDAAKSAPGVASKAARGVAIHVHIVGCTMPDGYGMGIRLNNGY